MYAVFIFVYLWHTCHCVLISHNKIALGYWLSALFIFICHITFVMNFFERYQFDRNKDRIGKGGFGEVYRAFDTLLHQNVAIKFYPRAEGQEKYGVIDEMRTAIKLHHPNIVRVFDADIVEITDNFGHKHVNEVGIMELVEGGSLRDFIDSKPSIQHIQAVVIGMIKGLEYLHNHGIIHRDLKPANILIKYENGVPVPKIVDFGISKQTSGDQTARTGVIGTYEYIAPEMLDVDTYGANGKIMTNVDLWSFGVMLYEIFTGGELPFGSRRFGMTEGQIIAKILGANRLDKLDTIPQPYKTIIQRCLIRNAAERNSSMTDLLLLCEQNTPSPTPFAEQQTQVLPNRPLTQTQARPQQQPTHRQAPKPQAQVYGSQAAQGNIQLVKANVGSRIFAWVIDSVISVLIFAATMFLLTGDIEKGDEFSSFVSLGLMYIYYMFKDGANGSSLGKRVLGLTVLHIASNQAIGYGRSFLRNVLYIIPILNFFAFFIDIIMLFADSNSRRTGDQIAGTMVVEKKYL